MPGHSKAKKMMKKLPKGKPRAAVMPRFGVEPPPTIPRMMKRRGMKNLMPKAFRKNVKIH